MHSQQKSKNPWNNIKPQKKNNNKNFSQSASSSDLKFKEAQLKLQASIKKHLNEYESSSEEEDNIDPFNHINNIFKNYDISLDEPDRVNTTQGFIERSFQLGALTCLICISKIKKDCQVWNCCKCYGLFHLLCIQRWSKDTITQQKHALEEQIIKQIQLCWCCPKCRYEYNANDVPSKYFCFCKKTENPKYQQFLVPHSCGEICQKDLIPNCGHKCLLLCHPGPCPPCPIIVNVSCYCGKQSPKSQRCSRKNWSCGQKCGKILECLKHACADQCHDEKCRPCPKKSIQKCVCKSAQTLRDCVSPYWHCEKECKILLDCGNHLCQEICHEHSDNTCPLTQSRTCPCGKKSYFLPCTEETPTCFDTCGKLLDCGIHTCNYRCHKEKCGPCLEIVTKFCRCGHHSKEIQCCKPYLCETKCKRMRDCNKHSCNRKCCDGTCPPCEKPCGHTLSCGNHKCNSVCHRGPCYPCNLTESVSCRCGATKLIVPCGRKYKTKPPECLKICQIPPECHHEKRVNHKCHFGDCPPCKQICNKELNQCSHLCKAICHSAVLIKIEGQKASMPWEQTKPQVAKKSLPCPDCTVSVPVTCLGQHEVADWPCYLSKPSSCQRACGRLLACGNHTCTFVCHLVVGELNKTDAGKNCEVCEEPCSKQRPRGCKHPCPKPCHPENCPPCKNLVKVKCHCGLNQLYIECSKWICDDQKEELQCCGNQCPQNYNCGHRCKANCHSGQCPNQKLCKKKVKITCSCKRLKKEFSCELVRNNLALVSCDEVCAKIKIEQFKIQKTAEEQKAKEEEEKNKRDLEKYKKMFEGKKKGRDRRIKEPEVKISFFRKYWILLVTILILPLSAIMYFLNNN